MLRLERIFYADINSGQFQRFRRFRMYSLHTDIRYLVGNNIIGMSNGDTVLHSNNFGIGAGKMVFFMNNGFIGFHLNRNLTESHL
ncbi:hypothetical protein SDC9_86532 [bioreactor metagenome]|uniref:Uncharacterized protein n=1 Tax=bioreactor metagenome TaxID=1076179 RepID=A0A644ZGD3_9ZZZZ